MRTTPTNVLLDINGEQPLAPRWTFLILRFLCKASARKSHPFNNIIRSYYEFPIDNRPKAGLQLDLYNTYRDDFEDILSFNLPDYLDFPFCVRHMKPEYNVDQGMELANSPDVPLVFGSMLSSMSFDASFYTDGSRSSADNPSGFAVGFAVYSPELNISFCERIDNLCSIFDAEALAILHTLNIIIEKDVNESVIFSDALSVVSSLGNPGRSKPKSYHRHILEIRQKLYICQKNNLKVKLFWIPSHKGIPGNEIADELATKSLLLDDPFRTCKCYYYNLYSKLKKITNNNAIDILVSESQYKGARYFNLIERVLETPWYKKIPKHIGRNVICLISRIRTYHTAINAHLWDKNIVASSNCPCGHHSQNLNHLFFECPRYSAHSDWLIAILMSSTQIRELDVPRLAFSSDIGIYELLHDFVIRTGLRI